MIVTPGKFHTTVTFNRFEMIGRQHVTRIDLGMKVIAEQVKKNMKSDAPVAPVAGTTLQRGISSRKIGQAQYELYNNVEYAVYQEFGATHWKSGRPIKHTPHMIPNAEKAGPLIDAMVSSVIASGGM
jgi:hypothetical protein